MGSGHEQLVTRHVPRQPISLSQRSEVTRDSHQRMCTCARGVGVWFSEPKLNHASMIEHSKSLYVVLHPFLITPNIRASPLAALIDPLGVAGVKFGLQPCSPKKNWRRRAGVIYPALPVQTQFLGSKSGAPAGGKKQAGQHCRRLGENISLFPPKLALSFSLFPPKLAAISPSTTAELLTPAIP
jgi:hypothetical protein